MRRIRRAHVTGQDIQFMGRQFRQARRASASVQCTGLAKASPVWSEARRSNEAL